ncbi:four-carbon acid sugar kinase family protein [Thalassobellus suaedae]|uniref:Four-carbon acid sugar kinase family protein n=1 Tax=Thalassobellus suaedae TaxID=3074124 RepID=A0ABY9Y2H0_9FLAO|nr:four-carbon acid sugar kinase family protein [Flavobacteriaceae bacterium HL-DH10]
MITVIADDLTGAAEIAGICLRYGIHVAFGIDTIPEKEATVNIIATDTRSMTEDEAYETHFHLAEEIISNTNNIIFKKCDSVLRGHVLTELSALLDSKKKDHVLLQPSNPLGNRCIKNASYTINDVLIENTDFALDPDFPLKGSLVKRLLLDRSSKKDTMEVFTGKIKEINLKGIYIPDCNSVEELSKCINLYHEETIIAGSAAFFEQFLIKMKLATSKIKKQKHSFTSNYLLLSGSTHTNSVQFSKNLEKTNCPLVTFPDSLLEDKLNETALSDFIIKIADHYNEHKKVALKVSNNVIQLKNSTLNLKTRMSLVAKRFVETSNTNELFIEGGATAYDLFNELHWKSFTPIEELASGVVRMQYDKNPNQYITIKPGSYKWPDGLIN